MKSSISFHSNRLQKRNQATTSPPLVGIEPNPGPKTKARRKVAKERGPKPRSRKRLTPAQKGEIKMGLKLGLSFGKLGKMVGCKDYTVSRLARKLEAGQSLENSASPGRPPKLSDRAKREIVRKSKSNRKLTAVDISKDLVDNFDTQISRQTVSRVLCDAGLPGRRAAKKPLLTQKQMDKRMEWAQKYKHWSATDWEYVVWSDESPFKLFQGSRRQYVRRGVGERFNAECIEPTVKHGGGGIQVWGCFHGSAVGPLVKIEGIMDMNVYHSILVYHAMPFVTQFRSQAPDGSTIVFQQDNDPKHTAKKNKNYLKSKCITSGSRQIVVMEWPSQSPDLNPIENLWDSVKDALSAKGRFSNKSALFGAVKEVWNSISKEELMTLVHGIPRRVEAVIQANGGATKY